jgi:hypothetical protein
MAKQQPRLFRMSRRFADLTAMIEISHNIAVSGQKSDLTLQKYRRIGQRLQKSLQRLDARCRSLISHLEEQEAQHMSTTKRRRTQ